MASTVIERYTVCIRVCRDKSRVRVRRARFVEDVNGARVRLHCYILPCLYIFLFSLTYSYIICLGEFNWIGVINNPVNELANDDGDYVTSSDTSFTSDGNNDYNDNIDFDSFIEMKKRFYESEGMTIQTSSDDSSLEKFQSSSANSAKS